MGNCIVEDHEQALGKTLEIEDHAVVIMPNNGKPVKWGSPLRKFVYKEGAQTGEKIRDILHREKGNVRTMIISSKPIRKRPDSGSDTHFFLKEHICENIISLLKGELVTDRYLVVKI